MEEYTCPDCGKVYPVKPKACSCEKFAPPDLEPSVEYALRGKGVVSLTKEEYQLLLKFAKERPKDGEFELMRVTSRSGVETADVNLESVYLTEKEFLRCKEWLAGRKRGA